MIINDLVVLGGLKFPKKFLMHFVVCNEGRTGKCFRVIWLGGQDGRNVWIISHSEGEQMFVFNYLCSIYEY